MSQRTAFKDLPVGTHFWNVHREEMIKIAAGEDQFGPYNVVSADDLQDLRHYNPDFNIFTLELEGSPTNVFDPA